MSFKDKIDDENFCRKLFEELYFSETEEDVKNILNKRPEIFNQVKWEQYGSENSFGVIENQQASPIPALVEKITNSIDAILMRRCYESGIDPKSLKAPQTMEEALKRFFPDSKNWDLQGFKRNQAEQIQIIADGPRRDTSLIIYDEGEGQNPEDFKNSFLSLLRNNKNEIRFVQGKYNMGGSGAIIFCGKNKYQLVASKKYDSKGKFGFTLIRRHPLTKEEESRKKHTWYEYFVLNGQIPSFKIDKIDLGLYNRNFITGTVIKLYSYDLPAGTRSDISRDLNQSLNEYLFEPALPILTVEKKERYPDDKSLVRDLYGLKRRLEYEEGKNKYIEDFFLEEYLGQEIGPVKITCYIFKSQIEGKNVKESKEAIRREFFKNNMSVLFSLNGQVHGHYTSEFISRSLKYQLLKDYLLIHVDCTNIYYNFRNELFMASRDRLKDGDESRKLREIISSTLRKSKLDEIYKKRKNSLTIGSSDTGELLKSFSRNLPLKNDLIKLLSKTYKIDGKDNFDKKRNSVDPPEKVKIKKEPFRAARYPSYFKLEKKFKNDENPITEIPLQGERSIKFYSDVENEYFVRIDDPGELKLAIVGYNGSDSNRKLRESENAKSIEIPERIEDIFNIVKKSPNEGTIKVILNPTQNVQVGDAYKVKATLSGPENNFDQAFWVKISAQEPKHTKHIEMKNNEDEKIGVPQHVLVYKTRNEEEDENSKKIWDDLNTQGVEFSYETIVHPLVEGDKLEMIYINMDSNVLKEYKSTIKTIEQIETAEKRYIASVYFHTLFLYTISKNKKYKMQKEVEGKNEPEEVEIENYIKDIFENYYSNFLLNFEMANIVDTLTE